jgi:uncharacterized protein
MANRDELALIRRARAGQAEAQLALGKLYLFGGVGLAKNKLTALHWLDRAARQDLSEAWLLIGRQIPAEAVRQSENPLEYCLWYERASNAGVLDAGLVLAQLVLIEHAHIAPPPLRERALSALESAAQGGLAAAQWLLAQQEGFPVSSTTPLPVPASAFVLERESNQTPETANWLMRAADGGVTEAQYVLMEEAWTGSDWAGFLRWAKPLALGMTQQSGAVPALEPHQVLLLLRCAQALDRVRANDDEQEDAGLPGLGDESLPFWELAAQSGDRQAQLWLGLRCARMTVNGERITSVTGAANFKKAIRWLTLAGEQDCAQAWYALSRIFMKPEFSQRNVADAQKYLLRAANLGYAAAQWECGSMAWRTRRENAGNEVMAVLWLQKAALQGVGAAQSLLEKIAPCSTPQLWAIQAQQMLTHEKSHAHPLLAARIELAVCFGLSLAEALLLDTKEADQGHCLMLDIRAHYGRSKRRLIAVQNGVQRQLLDRVERLFEDVDCGPKGPEGNYRQRVYRLKAMLPLLDLMQTA